MILLIFSFFIKTKALWLTQKDAFCDTLSSKSKLIAEDTYTNRLYKNKNQCLRACERSMQCLFVSIIENHCSLHYDCHQVVDFGNLGRMILKKVNMADADTATPSLSNLVDDMHPHSDSTLQPNSNTHSKKEADINILFIFGGLVFFLLLLCLFYFCIGRGKRKDDPQTIPLEPNDTLHNYDMKLNLRAPKPIPPFSDESNPENVVYLTHFLETINLFEDSIEKRESTPPPRFIDIQGQWRDIGRDFILLVKDNKCSILDPKDAVPPTYIYETQNKCYMNIDGETWILEKAADTATWRNQKSSERIEWEKSFVLNKRGPHRIK